MKKTIIKSLNLYYYGALILTLLSGSLSYFLIMKDFVQPIDSMSILGQVLQYAIIFDALLTIPVGLYLCKRQCTKLTMLADEEQKLAGYKRAATWRIILVSNTMIWGIAAFYLMGAYQSMLWITAVSAIGWYFTKPSEAKLQAELQPKDPNQEQY
jgi:Zn-dependent membrane protease YugP